MTNNSITATYYGLNTPLTTTTPGGTITSTTGPATFVANTGATFFSGNITNTPGNAITFVRSDGGSATFYMMGNNGYTGPTLIEGGGTFSGGTLSGTVLADNGALSGTSSVTINYSSLTLNNTSGTLTDSSSRINATAPITLNGGSFDFLGRATSPSNETLAGVTLASGNSIISSADQSNIGNPTDSATLTFASLSRTASTGATVEFAQNYQNNSAGQLGLISNGVGHSENILFTTAPTLSNNIIGGWAIASSGYFNTNTVEFAGYIPVLGVGALNTTGFAGYDNGTTGVLPATFAASQNLRLTTSQTLPAGGVSINSLNVANTTASTNIALTFTNPTDTLTVASGGLVVQSVVGGTATLGSAAVPGQVTSGFSNGSGGNDLYLYYYNTTGANVLNDYSAVVNNGSTPVRLVAYGGDFGAGNITLLGANTYTGGTLVNGETLTVGATGVLGVGGITLNGGALAQTAGGSLGSAAQSIAINGPSTLTLAGANTITSLTFNNNGGSSNPNISTTGGVLTISSGSITASSSNAGTTSVISAGTIDLNNVASPTFTINPISYNATSFAPSRQRSALPPRFKMKAARSKYPAAATSN